MLTSERVLLVGQAPSKGSDPARPLIGGRSGSFLQRLCGMTLGQYYRAFERVNLLAAWPGRSGGKGDGFPAAEARRAAAALAPSLRGRRVVALGRGVAVAFGRGRDGWLRWRRDRRGFTIAVVPHPSGVNRLWNAPANRERARRFFEALSTEVNHGKRRAR